MKDIKKEKPAAIPSFQEYFYANLMFWSVLLVAGLVCFFACGAIWDDVTQGALEFLFVIVGGGFTMVSGLDYFYEIRTASVPSAPVKTR